MSELTKHLDGFKTISLKEMNNVKLMDRTDTKFVFNKSLLFKILPSLKNDYKILKVNGNRFSKYSSIYFDTNDFMFYKSHHNGRINRVKIRFREYLDSALCFLEIKKKNPKGKTVKNRMIVKKANRKLSKSNYSFINKYLSDSLDLNYCHENYFNRITLVNQTIKERLTIDFNFSFKRHPKKINNEYNNIIIAELKQEKLNRNSFFYKMMRENRLRKTGMSKYCFATSSIFPSLKYNRFKSNFSILEKNNI